MSASGPLVFASAADKNAFQTTLVHGNTNTMNPDQTAP